jgi:hypothetical protein
MKREFGSLILAAILMTGAQASADGKGSQFGFMYGHSVPDAENTNPYILAGVKGEAFFLPTLSAGGYYLVSDGSGEPSVLDKFRYSIHGVQTAFHMAASGGDTWVALRVGLTKVKTLRFLLTTMESPPVTTTTWASTFRSVLKGPTCTLNADAPLNRAPR